jgi:hypothetical protein
MTREDRIAAVLRAIAQWIASERAIEYVPWALPDPSSKEAIEQNARQQVLSALDSFINNTMAANHLQFSDTDRAT